MSSIFDSLGIDPGIIIILLLILTIVLDDVGGKLSFALALLDQDNSGVILNAVHSRDNCFLYLKEIVKGESYVMLSQEELEALRKAVNFGLENIEKDE